MLLKVVEVARFEEAFVKVERHDATGRAYDRTFTRESEALREARYQRTLQARLDEMIVVFAMVFSGGAWVASREIACWRGVRCRVRAQTKTRWERFAPASEQPRGDAGGEATATSPRGCSGAGALDLTGIREGGGSPVRGSVAGDPPSLATTAVLSAAGPLERNRSC